MMPARMRRVRQRRTGTTGGTTTTGGGTSPGKRSVTGGMRMRGPKPAGAPMPADVSGKMERAFGADFSDVRVHEGPEAEEMGARAYAEGTDLHFAPGEYDPQSESGQELLGHELAHVVQQGAGQVDVPQGKGDGINADAGLEAEADAAGARAARGERVTISGATSTSSGIQRDAHGPGGGPNTASAGAASLHTVAARDYATIASGNVSDFRTYTQDKADWSMSIDAAHQAELRRLLTWLEVDDYRRTPIAAIRVSDVLAADLTKLDAYGRAIAHRGTIEVAAVTTLGDMVAIGEDVLKLEAVLDRAILHQIFTPVEFTNLRAVHKVDQFCNYVRTCAPLLHAHGGVEIRSFLTLSLSGDPASWRDVRDVRNTHRFQARALDTLRTNQAGNPGNKPLTLILHSAFDHNGAFHQDPNLSDVIVNATNHTVMIEGAESLDAIAARLPGIVAVHGRLETDATSGAQVRRIDQVMIAGHGSATAIELAGTIAENPDGSARTNSRGNLITNDDSLDVRHDPADPDVAARETRTRAFIQQVMSMMSVDPSSPHHRVVFNACLTASNEIPANAVDPAASPDDQARQMREAIAASPSIVNVARTLAPAGTEVRGGNGSFGQVGLIDGGGALDIVADGTTPTGNPDDTRTLDPELTNPDKLVYVEQGTDPGGCMSAVAECWANDRATCIPAVQRRRAAAKGSEWDETVIQAMYELVDTRYQTNGSGIAILAANTEGFKELWTDNAAHPWTIWGVTAAPDWTLLHRRLSVHGDWNDSAEVVFFHGWMTSNPAKSTDFLTAVGRMNADTVQPFLHMNTLYGVWGSLVPAAAGATPNAGSLVLALRDLVSHEDSPQANTRSFLSSMVTNHAFNTGIDVTTPLGGLHDADWVLSVLGLDAASAASTGTTSTGASAPPEGNVDMDVDGINESLVAPLSVNGRVRVATSLYVRDQAQRRGDAHASRLTDGEIVYIMGETGDWYLIDHGGTRGYSNKSYIELLESDATGAAITAPAAVTAEPQHPTTMRTEAIITELAAASVAADRRAALETELRTRRMIVSVSCLSSEDWSNDELSVRVTSASGGTASSFERAGVAAGQNHAFTVPIGGLLPISGDLTVDLREADVFTTDTVLSVPFRPPYAIGVGVNDHYVANVTFEANVDAASPPASLPPAP